jgi:hypothetical protein
MIQKYSLAFLHAVVVDGAVRLHYGFNNAGPGLKKVMTIVGCNWPY